MVHNRPLDRLGDGRYHLTDILGTGGMGLVYRAQDEVLHREVAIKVLADNLSADPDARERFEREARAAAKLNHPNVVQVFDVGEEDGRPYFVMELVAGPSLADVLHREGTLTAADAQVTAIQMLRGLGHSHDAGLLHRDLKPGNLLRAPDGTVKVTDFGVAQATEMPQMTRTGLVLGTLPYLAPERLAGAPATAQTDLYALGATLLELLTGAPPDARRDDGGRPIHGPAALDTVPPRLARFIERCLATDPAQRPASVAAALDELTDDGMLPTAPVEPRPAAGDTRVLTAAVPIDGGAPTERDIDTGAAERPYRLAGLSRWAAFAGIALLVVLALSQLGGGEPGTPAPAETPVAEEPAEPAPSTPAEGGDPGAEELMRDLGEDLRGLTGG